MAAAEPAPTYQAVPDALRPYGYHSATGIRWILRGVVHPRTGERIKLKAIRAPGKWLVPQGAVDRFLAAVTEARTGQRAGITPKASHTEHAAADAALTAAGW